MKRPGFTLLEAAAVLLLMATLAALASVSFRSASSGASARMQPPLMAAATGDAARFLGAGGSAAGLTAALQGAGLPAVPPNADPGPGELSASVDDAVVPAGVIVASSYDESSCLVVVSRTLQVSAALEWFLVPSASGCAASVMLASGVLESVGGSVDSPTVMP